MHAYLGGVIREQGGVALAINGTEDHVHLLVRYKPSGSISDLLRYLKSCSSGWIHDEFPMDRDFAWQEGYAVFSVSRSALDDVKLYIVNQKEHHRKRDFKAELVMMLRLHEVEFDER